MSFIRFRRFPFLRLLLATLLAALWFRSHSHSDIFTLFLHRGTTHGFVSDRGRLTFFFTNISLGPRRAYTYDLWRMTNDEFADARTLIFETRPFPAKLVGTLLGASGPSAFGVDGAKYRFIAVPFWMMAMVIGVPLAMGLGTFWQRRKWGAGGLCADCGYDLRASTFRCPECGRADPSSPH